MKHPVVFLDRDGTINEEVGYVNHIDRFVLLPRVGQAIRLLNEHGFKTVVITNQSGVARGYFPESLIHQVHQKLEELLREEGARLDGIYYCPHHPAAGSPPFRQKCRCRKPETGLIEKAVEELDLDLSRSYMIGDRGLDIEFGRPLGLRGVLVLTGYGKGEWEYLRDTWNIKPDHVEQDLYGAVQWILHEESLKENVRREKMPITKELLDILACPKCKGDIFLNKKGDGLICKACRLMYPIKEDIPVMLIDEALPSQGEE
jgi:D-glycero-D-manno-heptose 1,7-bisphosphate phosphatase